MGKGFSQGAALRNAKFMRKFWVKHIQSFAKQPNRGIIIIRPDYEKREQMLMQWLEEEKARNKAGGLKRPDFRNFYSGTLQTARTAIRFFSSLEKDAIAAIGIERVIVVQDKGQLEGSILSRFSSLKPTKDI